MEHNPFIVQIAIGFNIAIKWIAIAQPITLDYPHQYGDFLSWVSVSWVCPVKFEQKSPKWKPTNAQITKVGKKN
jgi:hypothetical protein